LINIMYNHCKAIFTSPGTLPDSVGVPHNIDDLIAEEQTSGYTRTAFSRYCRTCRKPKPARTHHCHICKKCILKMDHHCPWVANCVGHGNYRYFVLFTLYLMIGCLFIVVVSFPLFFAHLPRELRYKHEGPAFFGIILCGSAFFALGAMCGLHVYLILSNQTTIELYYNRKQVRMARARGEIYRNPYDLGRKKNFQAVFGVGKYYFSWLLLGRSPGDGMHFESRFGQADTMARSSAWDKSVVQV